MFAYVLMLAAATPEAEYKAETVDRYKACPDGSQVLEAKSCLEQAAQPPTVQTAFPRAARPLTNPGSWITTDDYPNAALKAENSGLVSFRLNITDVGSVDKCEILASSGTAELDAAACYLITARAKFEPAFDKKGKAIRGTYQNRVRWVLPPVEKLPVPVADSFGMTYVINETGVVESCERLVILPTDEPGACPDDPPLFEVPLGSDKNAVRKRITITTTVTVADEKPLPPPKQDATGIEKH